MGNGPLVPNHLVNPELQPEVSANTEHKTSAKIALSRTTMAAVLMMAAIAALATTGLIHSNQQATAQSEIAMAPATPAMVLSVPLDSGEAGPFALGFLVFEHDPANHLPGFAALPSGTPAR